METEGDYYAEMEVDGQRMTIKAGEKNYYMYSEFKQDSDQVYNFISSLRSAACSACEPAIQFQLNDFISTALNGSVRSDSSFQPGPRNFERAGRGPFYTVEFSGRYNRSALVSNYFWDFGNGPEATGVNVSRTFEFPGPYNVCLRVKGSAGCENRICNSQDFGNNAMRAAVTSTAGAGDTLRFSAQVTGGKAPYTYAWNLGDGSIQTGNKITHVYPVRGTYGVVLMVRDSSGKSISSNYNAITGTDVSGCTANYSINAVQTSTNGIQNWGKAGIRLTTSDGNIYSSNRTDQPSTSLFEVVTASPAGTNEKGEPIYKLKIRFAATLFNGTKFIQIKNGEAVIAVAYK